MDYIHKLPFLLGGFMAVIVGIASYLAGTANQAVYLRMTIALVAFYIVGGYIKNTVVALKEELRKKEEQKAKEEAAEEARRMFEAQAADMENQPQQHRVNLVADDDYDEEFTPMTVSRVIASKLKE